MTAQLSNFLVTRELIYANYHVITFFMVMRNNRLQSRTEKCSYCSASVPFETPEVAFCKGLGEGGHKLARCAASMEICPPTPLWFCMCCHRQVFRLPPETLFNLVGYPLDFMSSTESSAANISSNPLCPFCGILLQRLQPDFLLSASPV